MGWLGREGKVTQKEVKSSGYLDKHAHIKLIHLFLKASKGNSLFDFKNSLQNHNASFLQKLVKKK